MATAHEVVEDERIQDLLRQYLRFNLYSELLVEAILRKAEELDHKKREELRILNAPKPVSQT